MKILQVIPRFNLKLGGGVTIVYNASKYMVKRGHDVTIITTNYQFNPKFTKIIQKEGIEIIPFNYLFNLYLFIPSPNMKNWLSKNIKNYDVIHLNGARAYQNNVIYKYAKKHNIPYVLQAHGSVLRIIERQWLKKLYDLIWGYKILKGSSKVIALNHTEAEAYRSMGVNKDKIEILPNGIDLSKFSNLPKKENLEKDTLFKMMKKLFYIWVDYIKVKVLICL
jgi:glycosyltransferase involved in cell wall biosynthesis